MFLKAFVILSLGVASTTATWELDTTRTATIGPDAWTYRQNLQCSTVKSLMGGMTALANQVQDTFIDQQYSIYSGFSTTATTADTTLNNHHYPYNYAFRGEANSCSGWYECCIEYTGFSWSDITSNKNLETFLINLTPSVSSMPK